MSGEQVKIPWWKAGTGEWPTEAARERWERVAVEQSQQLEFCRGWCADSALVEPFFYWRDWYADAEGLAVSFLLFQGGRRREACRRERKNLMDELGAWDVCAQLGPLSLDMFLPTLPGVRRFEELGEWVGGVEEWNAWAEARVRFEGICKLSFGLGYGAVHGCIIGLDEGAKAVRRTRDEAIEIGQKAATACVEKVLSAMPGLGRCGLQSRGHFEVTQEKAAEMLGVSVRTVKNWEAGTPNSWGYSREKRRSKAALAAFVAGLQRDLSTGENMMDGVGRVHLGNYRGMSVKRGSQ